MAERFEPDKEKFKKAKETQDADNAAGLAEWDAEIAKQEAETDHLTGLATRKVFETRLDDALKAVHSGVEHEKHHDEGRKNPLKEVALIYIDLDYFKKVNDTFGHAAGDEALRRVAETLKNSVRSITDTVARLSGEELAVIMPGAGVEEAHHHAETLREEIEQLTFDADPDLRVTASFGIASSAMATDAATLKDYADKALYAAKSAGRNRINDYQPEP